MAQGSKLASRQQPSAFSKVSPSIEPMMGGAVMLADLVMMGEAHPYWAIVAIAVLCVAAIWHGTR